ncbi:MAG: RagB/SusD family nutrient uptake outer membrane protein, partial [Ginsengibacter sp.]
ENIGTYMFRLAEVYLDYADAIMGNNTSSTDPEALKYYNAVRIRAGIATKTSFTYADLTLERKIEFAFEGKAWYDWKTWYYFDPTDALNYFNTENRGVYNLTYNGGNSFVTYLNDASNPATVGPRYYTITSANVDLPYPEVELLVAHNLTLPPVPFDFSKLNY